MVDRLTGALLALFYLSGRYTLADSDGWAPDDTMLYDVRVWTLLALVALASTCSPPCSGLRRTKCTSARLVMALALLLPLYLVISFFWAIDLESALRKMLEATILATACVSLVPFWRAGRVPIVRHWFWKCMVLGTGLMCLTSCYFVDSTRMSVLGGGPNTFGRNMGLLFMGALYLQRRSTATTAWCWYPLMVVSLLMVLLSGSRGALLATSTAGVIYLLVDNRFRARNVLAVGCLVVAIQVVMFSTEMGSQALEMFETRILNLTLERQYMSGREELFAAAYAYGLERPWFGQGLSGYTILLGHNYPHNIALELFCEAGIVGVSLLVLLLMAALTFIIRHRRSSDPAIWGAFALVLISAMFSGDLYDSRGVFLMAMLGSQEVVMFPSVRSRTGTRALRLACVDSRSDRPALSARG